MARGLIKVGSYPHDDTHQVWLSMSTHSMIRLSVTTSEGSAPPSPSTAVAVPDRPAAADERKNHDDDANSHWNDDGGAWRDARLVAASARI